MRPPIAALLFLLLSHHAVAVPPSTSKQTVDSVSATQNIHRGAALPKWAQPLANVPATQRTDPVVVRLMETQAWVGAEPAILVNRAIQVNEKNSLGVIGQLGIDFYPLYQELYLHKLVILRGNQRIDRTATVNARQLQRETGMESGMYGGATTVQLLLDDVRVGDTLLMTYTIEGENPVFEKRWSHDFLWDSDLPTELRRLTVMHPKKRELYWRQIGDFRSEKIVPAVEDTGDIQRIRFEGRGMEELEYEPSVPSEYFPLRALQFSEYKDWREVATWADGLFPKLSASPAVKKLAQQFGKEPNQAARASAALQWVQNEIRYFSVSIGENSHRPQAPETVIKRRYGDCKDKTYLLVSLLTEMGINARPVLLSADAPKLPAKISASPIWFNHVIVQITLDGHVYYVDPTRNGQPEPLDKLPSAFPGASVLVVAADTQKLSVLPERIETEPQYEHVENILIPSFDGDATLEMRDIYRSSYADTVRVRYPRMTAAELKKDVLSSYEKQYPGITLLGTPSFIDNSATNVFEVRARFNLIKPVTLADKKYSIDFDSQIATGTLGIPNKLVRNFPLQLPVGKYHGRYRLNITWPSTMRGNSVPPARAIDGRFFSMNEEYIQQGNSLSFMMDYHVKEEVVSAPDLPALQKQAKQLAEYIAGQLTVSELNNTPPEAANFNYRDLDGIILSAKVLAKANSLKGAKTENIVISDFCDMIIEGMAVGDVSGKNVGQLAAETESGLATATGKRPDGVDLCRARILYANGDFSRSVPLYQKESPLSADSPYLRDLAWAKFYGGDAEGALTDMARYQSSRKNNNQGARRGFDTASEIALLQRSGKSISAELAAYATEIPEGTWPRPILAMQTGVTSEEDLLKFANTFSSDARELALTDAWYYIGQHRLARNDKIGAMAAFRWLNSGGIRSSPIYLQAKAELKRLQPSDANYQAGLRAFEKKDYATSFAKWKESAATGVASAQYRLGESYCYGYGVHTDYLQAMHWYEMAAAQNHPEAMTSIGSMHGYGYGVPKDDKLAVFWYKKAALLGEMAAQDNLGDRYKSGQNVEQDYVKAAHYYRLSAEQGYASGQADLAELYSKGFGVPQDYEQAFFWNNLAAGQNDRTGQAQLGFLYDSGYGVPQDDKKALAYYRLAAAQQLDWAQNNIGIMYENGQGVEKDYNEAVKWYRLAAEQGNKRAQNNLGTMYAKGLGVKQDDKEALAWYTKAAIQGEAKAQLNVYMAYLKGIGVSKNEEEAYKWLEKALEQGNAEAQNETGSRYDYGKGVAQDYVKAVIWYRKAALQESVFAQYNLGEMYYEGHGVEKNFSEAFAWCHKAADGGLLVAMNKLAMMYKTGEGVAIDYAESLKWLRLAAGYGSAQSQFDLGDMYGQGLGVAQDSQEAMKWFVLAANHGSYPVQADFAYALRYGRGIPKDLAKAAEWYAKAIQNGSVWEKNSLGDMYENGEGVPQDYVQAIKLYREAASGDVSMGFFSLGSLYQTGKGLQKNTSLAYIYYKIAAKKMEKRAGPDRDAMAKLLSPDELKKADEIATNWKPGMPLPGVDTSQ